MSKASGARGRCDQDDEAVAMDGRPGVQAGTAENLLSSAWPAQ